MGDFCSLCGVIETGPYCPRHGVLHRPFSIATYELDAVIAVGRRSFVFGGRDRAGATPVALKILRPQVSQDLAVRERFLRQAAAVQAVAHPHLVRVFEAGWDEALGAVYLAMEDVPGHAADAMIQQSGPLAWRQVVPLLVQICGAIGAAHACEISDGDFTAKKVLVAPGAHGLVARVAGFGLSSATVASDSSVADDLYGIGTVAHQLLTGRLPLEGGSAAGMLSDDPIGVNERFPSYRLPAPLDDVLRACRLRDPLLRPSLAELEARLRGLGAGEDGAIRGVDPPEPTAIPQAPPRAVAVTLAAPGIAASQARAARPAAPLAALDVPPEALSVALSVEFARVVDGAGEPAPAMSVGTGEVTPGSGASSTPAPTPQAGTATSDPLAPPEMIGSYRVVGALGAGGTGRVYLGQHPVIGSKVAIKILLPEIARSPETVERFLQEARASSQIASPHIPRYFDFGTTPAGLPYAMMEYFDGETLGDRLARTGAMSIEEAAEVIEQVASALLMAHEAGLIHRDLKPDNIFLVKRDPKAAPRRAASLAGGPKLEPIQVKVLDFGIAKLVNTPSATQTQTGYFLGTPAYCAPEQVFGGAVDARTDVYSLGATAFEMLTGAPPFTGEVPNVLSTKATSEPPSLARHPGVPAEVAATIATMLARDPDDRAASMAWVLEQVAGWPERVSPAADRADVASGAMGPIAASVASSGPVLAALPSPPEARDDRDPASTSQAMRAITRPAGRARRWAALAGAGAVAAAAGVVLLVGSPGDKAVVRAPAARPAAGEAPPTAPRPAAASAERATGTPASGPPDGSSAPRQPAPEAASSPGPRDASTGQGTKPPAASSTRRAGAIADPGRGSAIHPSANAGEPGAGSAQPRGRGTRPADRKPPPDKPGQRNDVLIVDPFSQSN